MTTKLAFHGLWIYGLIASFSSNLPMGMTALFLTSCVLTFRNNTCSTTCKNIESHSDVFIIFVEIEIYCWQAMNRFSYSTSTKEPLKNFRVVCSMEYQHKRQPLAVQDCTWILKQVDKERMELWQGLHYCPVHRQLPRTMSTLILEHNGHMLFWNCCEWSSVTMTDSLLESWAFSQDWTVDECLLLGFF